MSRLAQFASRDAHPLLQFIKYGICGVAATLVHQGIFFALSYTIIPAGDGIVINGVPIDDHTRYWNGVINNLIAIGPSCMVAYITNVLWVFTPGRHSRAREMTMFFSIAAVGNLAGLIGGPMLIKWFGIPTWMSQLTFIFTSFLVNFLCRKFLIFKK